MICFISTPTLFQVFPAILRPVRVLPLEWESTTFCGMGQHCKIEIIFSENEFGKFCFFF